MEPGTHSPHYDGFIPKGNFHSAAQPKKYRCLTLLERYGHILNISTQHVAHLKYLVLWTKPHDWDDDAPLGPIVYASVIYMSNELQISEDGIRRRERALEEKGLITVTRTNERRRFGERDSRGRHLIRAFGVDLNPLLGMLEDLEKIGQDKEDDREAWKHLRTQLSGAKAAITKKLKEAHKLGLSPTTISNCWNAYHRIPKTTGTTPPEIIADLLQNTQLIQSEVDGLFQEQPVGSLDASRAQSGRYTNYKNNTPILSESNADKGLMTAPDGADQDGHMFAHRSHRPKGLAKKPMFGSEAVQSEKQPDCPKKSEGTGIDNISLELLELQATEDLIMEIKHPMQPDLIRGDETGWTWEKVRIAASQLAQRMAIYPRTIKYSATTLTANEIAVCILIIDKKIDIGETISDVNAYLKGMADRSRTGDLHLDRTIFRLSKRS